MNMRFKNLKIGVRLGISLSVIIVLFIGVSLYMIRSMQELSELTHKLHDHPYTVSTAALRIGSGIVKMHRSMKDVALAKDVAGIDAAAAAVTEYEREVYKDFDIIAERFLGDKQHVKEIREHFAGWKSIRDEVIELMRAGERLQAADITKGKGANYVQTLFEEVQGFIDFADTKADSFVEGAETSRNRALFVAYLTLALTVITAIVLGLLLTRSITRPLAQTVRFADQMANGDLTANIQIYQKDEIGSLANAFRNMNGKIRDVLEEMNRLIQAVQDGRLDTRGSTEAFAGGWRELVVGVNTVIDAFVTPINVTAEYLERIAKGDVPEKITEESRGDFNEIKNNLNLLIDNISSVLQETNGLIQAVQNGKLNVRGNAEVYSGDWRELVVGVDNVINAFVKPLTMTAESLDRIAKGDVPDTITEDYKGDFNEIKNNLNMLIDAMHDITRLAEEMAEGNLTVDVKERSSQDTLMQALNTMVQRLREVALTVKSAADNVASASQGMSSGSEQMSQGATEQAAAAEEASTSMEQMAANIRQNTDNALQTEKIAVKSAMDAQEGGKVVAETVTAMQEITKRIMVIEEIARQTHMLSLNATIEAAKAQEYGKGFGVVASEVRALAARSQTAAVDINQVASDSIAVAEKAGAMLTKLVPDIQKTAELVQEISAASNEQNTGTEQINRAIQQLDQVIQQNSATSEEMAATAEESASQAEQLRNTVAFFRIDGIDRETMNAVKKGIGEFQISHLTEASTKVAEKKDHKDVEKDKGNGRNSKSTGYFIGMKQSGREGDDLDAEFERF